jgi:hypothetical protein
VSSQADRNTAHREELETAGITITALERSEWSRLAIDAYRLGLTAVGHRFSVAAATGVHMPIAQFDALQTEYRSWLTAGFPGLEAETLRARETRGDDTSKELAHYRANHDTKG